MVLCNQLCYLGEKFRRSLVGSLRKKSCKMVIKRERLNRVLLRSVIRNCVSMCI